MQLRLSSALAAAIRAQARGLAPQECCGLMLGDVASATVLAIRPAANVAADPVHAFEIDPAVLIAVHKAARAGGPAIIGPYHSHPHSDSRPSAHDAAQAEAAGEVWLIAGADDTLSAWRAAPGGALHDRFEALEIVEPAQ